MIKYNVYYKNTRIGILYIDSLGRYKYLADSRAINAVEKEENVCIITDAKTDYPFGEPIAFFDSRIKTSERAGEKDFIKYSNSEYYFIKDNSGPCSERRSLI